MWSTASRLRKEVQRVEVLEVLEALEAAAAAAPEEVEEAVVVEALVLEALVLEAVVLEAVVVEAVHSIVRCSSKWRVAATCSMSRERATPLVRTSSHQPWA
jgi:hypothetical protein